MSQSQKVCYSCRKPLISMSSYYCCNPGQLSCYSCSHYTCKKCKNHKNVLFKPSGLKVNKVTSPSDISRGNRCDNCNSSESIAYHKFYQEKKCKKYYCHTCMEIFYSAYKKLVNSFLKDNGVALQIQVELRCGCDIPQSQIIAYLRKYCIDCSEQITKKSIVLTNNCIIMVECIRKLENQFMSIKFNASKKNQLGQVLQHIKSLIAVCTVCDMKIDGYLRTEWEMIDNMCICSDCLQSSKEKQQFYVSSGKKRKGERQQHRKPQQPIDIQKVQIKKCKSCRLDLKKSDQQNDLCETCTIKHLKSIKQQPKQSFQQIKINRIPNKKLQRQKQNQNEQLSSPLKSKINDPLFPNQSSLKKLKPQLSSPIKEHQNQQDIPDQQYISFPSQSNIQRAALQSENISFKLQFPQEDIPQSKCCCQCKCMFEDTLITYKRQKDRQQTIRIAQVPEQITKYTKQNRIQIYCKSCYLQLKFKIKLNKSNDVFRRGDVRRTGSMPKPPVKNVNTQSKYKYLGGDYDNIYDSRKYDKKEDETIKCTKCKNKLFSKPINKEGLCIICLQDHQRATDRLLFCSQCKNFIEIKDQQSKAFKQKLCQLCLQRKSLKSNQIRCEKCRKYKPQYQFKMNLLICKQCETTQLYSPIQKKQQQKYIEYICKKCKKIEKVKQSQKGKSIHCTNCLMNSHTAQHRARFT